MSRIWEGKEVRVTVSDRAIEKASRLFNASLSDIINELFQNARRAEANTVHARTLEENGIRYAEIKDDGIGMFRDDITIALGGGEWSRAVSTTEDPAGMGIFSLSLRGVQIESCGWKLSLTPDQFVGKLPARVERGEGFNGTRIRFPISNSEERDFRSTIKRCAWHYPLPVFVEGKAVQSGIDFLSDAVRVEEWRGLRIGVVRNDGGKINFYGLVVNEILPNLIDVERHMFSDENLYVRVDVVSAPELRLVLPARKEAVKDAFFDELKEECLRAIFRHVKERAHHRLSYSTWAHAYRLGVVLPPATKRLFPYSPMTARDDSEWYASDYDDNALPVEVTALVVADTTSPPESQMLYRAVVEKIDGTLLKSEPSFIGYSWYDALPVLVFSHVEVETNGRRYRLSEYSVAESGNRVDVVRVHAMLLHADREPEEMTFLTDVALLPNESSYNDDLSEVDVLVTRECTIDMVDVADLLKDSYFCPVEDSADADSVETQEERFEEAAIEKAATVLVSVEEALRQRVMLAVEREVRWLLPDGVKASIEVSRRSTSVNISRNSQ